MNNAQNASSTRDTAHRERAMPSAVAQAGVLGLCLLASFLAAAIGGGASAAGVREWYQTLVRPSFAPPDWVFGPVWTLLYTMMAVAMFLGWRGARARGDDSRVRRALRWAIGWHATQLVLNALWSVLFFGLRMPGLALIEIVLLLGAIVATTLALARLSKPAAWMMSPYIAWVAFATVLNAGFWWLNR